MYLMKFFPLRQRNNLQYAALEEKRPVLLVRIMHAVQLIDLAEARTNQQGLENV